MSYDLVLTDRPQAARNVDRDVGENILFADLPTDYKVYALYFSGEPPDSSLEDALRSFGKKTGKNLMMYMGSQGDPQLDRILARFEVKTYPVIIMTALADLASPVDDYVTTYARLDNLRLLSSPERTVQCVEKIFNLFLRGEVAQAISQAKKGQRAEILAAVLGLFGSAFKTIGGFISERDITLEWAVGKIELKRSGGMKCQATGSQS